MVRHLIGIDDNRLVAVAALLQADGERVDGRLHVRVLRVHKQAGVTLQFQPTSEPGTGCQGIRSPELPVPRIGPQ